MSKNDLKSMVDKLERLESDKANVAEYIRDTYLEAKVQGFDPKILRQVIRLRKMKREERIEQEELLDLYWSTLHGANTTESEGSEH